MPKKLEFVSVEEHAEDAEIARLRKIEAAVKAWLDSLDANQDPQMLYEADVALELRDILAGKGPAGEEG